MTSHPADEQIKPEATTISTNQKTENCPVCLQSFSKSRSYTSTCHHSFCFECLLQWSNLKHNCPLCKQPFERILFSLGTRRLDFKEYQLPQQEDDRLIQPLEIIGYVPPGVTTLPDNEPITQKKTYSKASWMISEQVAPIEFRMLVYLNNWWAFPRQVQYMSDFSHLVGEFEQDENFLSDFQCQGQTYISYRTVRSFRDTSWQWYDTNPACTHRLMSFIHRELKALACLLKRQQSKLPAYLNLDMRARLMSILIGRLKEVDIVSEEFLNTVKQFVGAISVAQQFQHELESFARSTSTTLADYDSKCVYYPKDARPSKNDQTQTRLPNVLPVNLNKYRLHFKHESDKAENCYSPVVLEETQEVTTPDANISDSSSFCEEIEVPPPHSPEYVLVSSSKSRSRSRSISSRNKKNPKKYYSSMSRSMSRSRSMSPRKHKKSKNYYDSRSRSMSRSRSISPRKHKKSKIYYDSRSRSRSMSPRKHKKSKKYYVSRSRSMYRSRSMSPRKHKKSKIYYDSRSRSPRKHKKSKKKKNHGLKDEIKLPEIRSETIQKIARQNSDSNQVSDQISTNNKSKKRKKKKSKHKKTKI